jgi:Protein of unknown function (DUF3106)
MNRPCQMRYWLAFFAAGQLMVFSLPAENFTNVPVKLLSAPTNIMPPLPQTQSPVDFFRELLEMSPRERANFLTNKPPEIRARILDKVREYLALDPDERELRLRATELRWYLMPLLRESPTNRVERLALVPDDIRGLVEARLEQWDILPPPLQKEFLENERTLRYFSHVDATNNFGANEWHHEPSDTEQSRWNALSEEERQRISAQFNQFFELTPAEKQTALNTLSDAERRQMEKTLQSFDKLPPAQRRECVRAFTKFAEMSPQDRTEFLKNAERWSQLSPKERQAWRDLVAEVPQWPPLPTQLIMPPLPPRIPLRPHPIVVTNLN